MGRAYSVCRREGHTKFWEETLKKKGHLEKPVPRWEGNIKIYL
jgi:hypothetical protein